MWMKFDLAQDRERVIGEGPWMLFNHYLAVCNHGYPIL